MYITAIRLPNRIVFGSRTSSGPGLRECTGEFLLYAGPAEEIGPGTIDRLGSGLTLLRVGLDRSSSGSAFSISSFHEV